MTDDDQTAGEGAEEPGAPGVFMGAGSIQAEDIATLFSNHPNGVAAFKAFVSATYPSSTNPDVMLRRLYTDDTGWEWVEAADKEIVGQLRPGPNPTDPRSLVFLEREALVTVCRVGYASAVKDQAFGSVDPRSGPNPPPRRPPY